MKIGPDTDSYKVHYYNTVSSEWEVCVITHHCNRVHLILKESYSVHSPGTIWYGLRVRVIWCTTFDQRVPPIGFMLVHLSSAIYKNGITARPAINWYTSYLTCISIVLIMDTASASCSSNTQYIQWASIQNTLVLVWMNRLMNVK